MAFNRPGAKVAAQTDGGKIIGQLGVNGETRSERIRLD